MVTTDDMWFLLGILYVNLGHEVHFSHKVNYEDVDGPIIN